MFSTSAISEQQLRAMWRACSEIAALPTVDHASRRLAEHLSQIIAAPTVVFQRRVAPWKLAVTSSSPHQGVTAPSERLLDQLTLRSEPFYAAVVGPEGTCWTPVSIDDGTNELLLLLPGDWHQGPAAEWLERLSQTASLAIRVAASRDAVRRSTQLVEDTYAFARTLADTNGQPTYQGIVDEIAHAATARLAGLFIYNSKQGVLRVSATFGYPSEIVGDVRILPGVGIIGSVFSARKPLLVRDRARLPGLKPASERYQTSSFMAVPLVAANEALAVVTLADRADGDAFTRQDLATVRSIGAVSSLALLRERLAQTSAELALAVAIDPLTGVFNRGYLQTRLEAELERSRRTGVPVSLIMLDVDSFKQVNDRLGHQAGDAVLRKVAEIIRGSVRASDVCTRYGGDEFAVIVPENAASAFHTAERVRSRVENFRWASIGTTENWRVTVSVGVSVSEAGDAPDRLLSAADRAMYAAKAGGRNRVSPSPGPPD